MSPCDLDVLSANTGVAVRAPEPGIRYIAACDASGGRNDSFTAAIAHRERDGRIVLDVAFERKSPFNPSEVVSEIVALMRAYRCTEITGDNYGAAWTVEAFAKAGGRYTKSELDRSAVYMNCMPLFTSGRARLLDNPKLISQFAALERRTFSTGRERVDPGPGHDDLCNSCAIALSLADGKASLHFTEQDVAAVSRPPSPAMSRFSRPMRFDRGRRGAPMPLGGYVGNVSDIGGRSAPQPVSTAPSAAFGSVSFSDEFGNK